MLLVSPLSPLLPCAISFKYISRISSFLLVCLYFDHVCLNVNCFAGNRRRPKRHHFLHMCSAAEERGSWRSVQLHGTDLRYDLHTFALVLREYGNPHHALIQILQRLFAHVRNAKMQAVDTDKADMYVVRLHAPLFHLFHDDVCAVSCLLVGIRPCKAQHGHCLPALVVTHTEFQGIRTLFAVNVADAHAVLKYETKWVKTSRSKIEYYKELINYFYNNDDIRIRILVAKNKEDLNNDKYNSGDYQEWYYKMYYYLLDKFIDSNYDYYMLYDEKDKYTTYKMNKVKDIIKTKKSFNDSEHFNFKIKQINSKESELMQLLDVVMGAVGYKNRGYLDKEKGEVKKEIVKYIEEKFAKNISETTSPFESKFNIFIWSPRKEAK